MISPHDEHTYQRISSIRRVVGYTPDLAGLIAIAVQPETKIISFAVTEAGYCLDAKNRLDLDTFADLRADLAALRRRASANGTRGWTIYGALTALLRARKAAGAGPVTLMNCDNLRHNGERLRSGLLQYIAQLDDGALGAWVDTQPTSPNAMVDRITPRPTPAVRERVKAATGIDDPAAVTGESFIQWVTEDNFIAGRPAWESAGAEMVLSMQAHEEAKIRLPNATHSCIAWAGTLVTNQ